MKPTTRFPMLALVALLSAAVPGLAAAAPEAAPPKVSASAAPKVVKQKPGATPGVVTPNPRPGGTGSGAKKPTIDPDLAKTVLGASAPSK